MQVVACSYDIADTSMQGSEPGLPDNTLGGQRAVCHACLQTYPRAWQVVLVPQAPPEVQASAEVGRHSHGSGATLASASAAAAASASPGAPPTCIPTLTDMHRDSLT
jgi:hypothetical protein